MEAQTQGWGGLWAVRSGMKGKAGDQAGKVSKVQTMEQGPQIGV